MTNGQRQCGDDLREWCGGGWVEMGIGGKCGDNCNNIKIKNKEKNKIQTFGLLFFPLYSSRSHLHLQANLYHTK